MTPQADSPPSRAPDSRPLDFHHWLASCGMNPNRPRPPGRTAALLMDYRAYLVKKVGKENAGHWLEKYAPKAEGRGFSPAERPQDKARAVRSEAEIPRSLREAPEVK